MSKKSKQLKKENPSNFILLPIAFIISVVPLIVFMKANKLSAIEIQNWLGGDTNIDFFSYYKSQWLIIGTIFALIFFLAYSLIKKFEIKKSFIYIPVITYASLIILSTITSEHPEVALNGFVARYEGMWALLCYLALMVITFNLVKEESQIKFLLGAFLISATIIGLIGAFQYFNMDIFRTNFGKLAILPEAYHEASDSLEFRFKESSVYSTLSNTNYVGSYVALVFPIAFVAFLSFKKIYMKIGAALLMVVLLISLIGSKSSAGVVGLVATALLALIIFRKVIFKRKILSIIVIAVLVIGFFGANYAMGGAITTKIKSEIGAAIKGNPAFDLQDIIIKDNTVSIVSGTETLVIEIDEEDNLKCYDGQHNIIKTKIKKREKDYVLSFIDERYKESYRYLIIEGPLIKVYRKHARFDLYAMEDRTLRLVGLNGELINMVEKPETIGFLGKEKIGSNRGYIWSRTIPLLKDSLIKGFGPDTFAIVFPQNDYIGKIRAFAKPQMIVDKPHNMYLQIGVNTGALSLLAFLVLVGIYAVQSLITYLKMEKGFMQFAGAGIFVGVSGYLITGFFNDSVVGIAPIFWVLLGLGFLCNKLVRNQQSST